MSFTRPHHHARIVAHNHDWERAIRCTIILKSLLLAVLVLAFAAAPVYSAETKSIPLKSSVQSKSSSTGKGSPCAPPQNTRMEKSDSIAGPAHRLQRNAVSPPAMSHAMALSIALGLRNATGPVVKSVKAPGKAVTTSASIAPTRKDVQSRTLTASATHAQCARQLSMR